MKNIILITLLTFPFLMMAQTKAKKSSPELRKEKIEFTYMTMEYNVESTPVKSPKRKKEGVKDPNVKKSNYVFNSNDKKTDVLLEKRSLSFKNEVMALNFLSKMGWELIDVDNGKYYLKSKRKKY